jgi:hypothetical protein
MKMPFALSKIGDELTTEVLFPLLMRLLHGPLATAHSSLSPTTFPRPRRWLSTILQTPTDLVIVLQEPSLKKSFGVTSSKLLQPSSLFTPQI